MTQEQSIVYLGLGANIGDRLPMLQQAVKALNELDMLSVLKISGVYETEPWGLIDQPHFLNVVIRVETVLAPLELLGVVKALEKRLGRLPTVRWGPRVIDIDVILWGGLVMNTEVLTIPHEHFRERHFVLTPLAEIASAVVDPVTGSTIAELLCDLASEAPVRYADTVYS